VGGQGKPNCQRATSIECGRHEAGELVTAATALRQDERRQEEARRCKSKVLKHDYTPSVWVPARPFWTQSLGREGASR